MSLCVSSAFAANEIYIGKDNNTSNDVNSIAITQSGSANVNKIGTNGNDHFAVEGKWGSINITQTNGAALISAAGAQTLVGSPGDTNYVPERGANSSSGNSITGFIRNASTGSGNTTTLVQNGDGNSIALAIGADTMTFSLRAVSTKSGEILSDVLVKKTVESIQANGHILKIIGIDLYSAELGGASNEPVGLALYQAVQLSVEVLTQKGMVSGWWTN